MNDIDNDLKAEYIKEIVANPNVILAYGKAREIIMEVLEKQVPKKIFRHPWNGINNVPYDLCPSCETNLCTEAGMFANKKMNYCKDCGQKLDWN